MYRFLCFNLLLLLGGCQITQIVPEGGSVVATDPGRNCPESEVCQIDVENGSTFSETFTAIPNAGYTFSGWKQADKYLCGGSTQPCALQNIPPDFTSQEMELFLEPIFEPDLDLPVLSGGVVDPLWTAGINAFDEALNWQNCSNDGGAGCPSIDWRIVEDDERGKVLEVAHSSSGLRAGLFIGSLGTVDLSDYANGFLVFDIKVISGDSHFTAKLDCIWPCTSGDISLGSRGANGWETVSMSMADLASGDFQLTKVNTGIVIWATSTLHTVFRLDNVRFTGIADGAVPPDSGNSENNPDNYTITAYGSGSISDTINPASYRCVYDFGNWIYSAGVVEPGIAGCNTNTGIPSGTPSPLLPQLSGPAAEGPTPTHRWWGSVSFYGEMQTGDPNSAAYITPDPITARISEKGARLMGIPSGLTANDGGFWYPIPDPFSEVFDGIAVGNSAHDQLDAFVKNHSDGSVTVEWKNQSTSVMDATFVHGSPYVYFKAHTGDLVLRTLRDDGGEKGIFYQGENTLGVWTHVAGNLNYFLVIGDESTSFSNVNSNNISVTSSSGELTVALLPVTSGVPDSTMIEFFHSAALNSVDEVRIDYSVNHADQSVTITHNFLDSLDQPVETVIGMHPLHWKNSTQDTSGYQVRSARGIVKFAQTTGFSYDIPFGGVLPFLPSIDGSFDKPTLENLITEFISTGQASWNSFNDVYWSGKSYSKVSELIAIADNIGMSDEAATLRTWLKDELEDWFSAETDGLLDTSKYFVYDDDWNTLLGLEESFASHQQLNDHHFHYGYLVRAAAEICRVDKAWCSAEQFGPMIELLIRDYAGGRDDPMFPYLRHFDPANGFSWASGSVNFARGNNNESTSEAANAYGAMILYGLITENDSITDRGIYLHASTAASFWEYWNDIDGYNNEATDRHNFPSGFNRITTSIIWGDGSAFSTWFSPAYAHILGIQALPMNPLVFHVGQYPDYLQDYVSLGMTESANGNPSGLVPDQWRDLWWNIWALTDADAAIADYNTVDDYVPEFGETKAHTYHWIHTLSALGQLQSGDNAVTADYPGAVVFNNQGVKTYVIYNFSEESITVEFSDGRSIVASANAFTVFVD